MINENAAIALPTVYDGSDPVAAAYQYNELGYSILPVKLDGSKAPDCGETWKPTEADEFTPADVAGKGIGIKCGEVSEYLAVFDFESVPKFDEACEILRAAGKGYLIDQSPIASTPRPGRHLYLHLEFAPPSSRKLALYLDDKGKPKTLIETRAQGSYIVAPGSPPGVHENGDYTWLQPPTGDFYPASEADYEMLVAVCESLTLYTTPETQLPESLDFRAAPDDRNLPGDDYNRRGDLVELLKGHGFKLKRVLQSGTQYWQKPNASDDRGHHFTFMHNGKRKLHCFTSSCEPFAENERYSPFVVYALLKCNGDLTEAARQLSKAGYGEPLPKKLEETAAPIGAAQDDQGMPAWGEPVPLGDAPVSEIDPLWLPEFLGEFCAQVSQENQTPPGLAVSVVLAALAACAQRRFVVMPQENGSYTEPLSLWTVSILGPGNRKTAVFRRATDPILAWETRQALDMVEAIKKNGVQRTTALKRHDELAKKAAKAETETDRQAFVDEMLSLEIPEPLVAPKVSLTDATPESFSAALAEHGARMSVLNDEGGWFDVMAGLYTGGQSNVDVFLQGHCAGMTRTKRKDRDITLRQLAISVGLAVQPEVIRQMERGNKSSFRGKGILGRFLFYYPVSKIGSRDVRSIFTVQQSVEQQYEACLQRLLNVKANILDDGTEVPRVLTLSAEARALYLDFSEQVERDQLPGRELEHVQDWGSKLAGATLRIAGLLHVAINPNYVDATVIDSDTMQRAIQLGQAYKGHAIKVLSGVGSEQAVSDARRIEDWIKSSGKIRLRDGQRCFNRTDILRESPFQKGGGKRLTAALEVLCDRNLISREQSDTTTRKATKYHWVNPLSP